MDDRYWRMQGTFAAGSAGSVGSAGSGKGTRGQLSEAWTSSGFSTENSLTAPQPASDRGVSASVSELARIRPPTRSIPREEVPRSLVIALAVILFVYLFTCGAPRLFDQIDGQYAGAAREMMARGDWITPTQDGVPRLQKPPLVYWCEIFSMKIFGVREFGARFPVALATTGWFLATGLVARRVVGTRSAGLAAALILAMFAATFFFVHLVMPEPFLACFMALSFWSLLQAEEAERERTGEIDRWLIAAWIFIALGMLAKGLHALTAPVVAVSFTAWLRPAMRPLWHRFLLRPHGWILLFTLLLPWYLIVEWRYPGFMKDHFLNEQIGSALSRRWPPDSDRVPLWIFWPEHLVLLFPISLLFPAAIKATFRARKDRRPWISNEGLLLLAWFLVIGLGISFSNIQDYYLMIAWAPIAVWIAWTLTENRISFKLPAVIIALLGAVGLLAAALFAAVPRGGGPGEATSSSLLIGDTILNVFQVLPIAVWKEFVPLACVVSASALVAGFLVLLFNRRGRPDLCLAGCGLLMGVIFLTGTRGMQLLEDQFSSAKIAHVIKTQARPQSIAIVQGDPNIKTTLFFYFHHPVLWVDGHPNIEFATRSLGIGRDHYLTREQVASLWREANQVFLVIDAAALPEWKAYLAAGADQVIPIGICGSSVILANR